VGLPYVSGGGLKKSGSDITPQGRDHPQDWSGSDIILLGEPHRHYGSTIIFLRGTTVGHILPGERPPS
jgi:hypothetical protein